MLRRHVAVVGAGYAGMAAAVALADAGVRVSIHEAASVPGGRARRVEVRGVVLDNGQHLLLGAYHELLGLVAKVGVPAQALQRAALELRYADGFRLRAPPLPAPFGLLAGLLLARGLNWGARLRASHFMLAMKRRNFRLARDMSVDALLAAYRQHGRLASHLWIPLCVSALNTPSALASANVFLAVLRDGLAGTRADSDLLFPRVDLSALFPEPAADYVRARGGELHLDSRVQDLAALRDSHDAVVLATGPQHVRALLPEFDPGYAYQPIVTCYLQYAKRVTLPLPMLGIAGATVQWVFDRGALLGAHGQLACVISAEGAHQALDHEALAAACHLELARALPGLPAPLWNRVIAEKRATIRVDADLRRIDALAAGPGIVLAGDYLDPDYPPTLEAAVRSGLRAAGLVLRGASGRSPEAPHPPDVSRRHE
jgi:squalene-associated FAD-dependent desaturase